MEGTQVLNGDLKFLTLAEVLQLLNSSGASGTLRLNSPYAPEAGLVYFSKGNLINAICGQKQGADAVYGLFGWMDGEFGFTAGEPQAKKVINQGVMEMVLDGLRMLDDKEIPRLGPPPGLSQEAQVESEYGEIPIIKRPVANYGYVVDEDEIADGQTIVQEGKHGSWVCVILEGYADVLREAKNEQVRIVRLGPGALVGNISSLLSRSSLRTATVVSAGGTVLGVLDLQRLHAEFSVLSFDMRQLAVSLDYRLREATSRVMENRLGQMDSQAFIKGRKIMFEQGAEEEGLYRITEGTASIVRNTQKGPVPLASLNRGDFVGQFPFANIGHETGSAAVWASEDCKVQQLDLVSLTREYEDCSSMVRGIVEHVAQCISVTTKLVTGALGKAS
ncbi:MAG: cyclic nucleotide-binding domain-containing protein [Desulfatibacillaceae bacterium]|nr:cyclic nucleotide-binding domain-containing protein [Desulfatibacillaceae bacterium]